MTNTTTNQPLLVSNISTMGPHLRLPLSQLDEVRRLLDGHGIGYWVGENAISFNGAPANVVIKFGREGNAAAIQAVLDSVA